MDNDRRQSWHDRPITELPAQLATDALRGLTPEEAAQRLHTWGPNELRKGKTISPLAILAGQFRSLVIGVLIGAALARLAAPRARVVRGAHAEVIAAAAVVPGDVLLLEAGDLVAADARVVEASAFRTSEAPLTGESQPVDKQVEVCAPETPLAERHNMVFFGTSVAGGAGRALVVATGMDTEVGHIATLLDTATSDITPLQRRLDRVARRLLWACLAIVALVIAELLRAFGARSDVRTVWQVGLFSNMRLFMIVAASFALQLAIHHLPTLQTLFRTEPISVRQCVAWIALGSVPLIALELRKVLFRSRLVGKPLGEAEA